MRQRSSLAQVQSIVLKELNIDGNGAAFYCNDRMQDGSCACFYMPAQQVVQQLYVRAGRAPVIYQNYVFFVLNY